MIAIVDIIAASCCPVQLSSSAVRAAVEDQEVPELLGSISTSSTILTTGKLELGVRSTYEVLALQVCRRLEQQQQRRQSLL
jgi:hypothetical protein